MKLDLVINLFSHNEVKNHFHICDNSIFTFGIRGLYLEFRKTSHIDSLDMFKKISC